MDIVSQLLQPEIFLVFIGFLIFIVIAYKFIRFLVNVFIIGLVSAFFPLFANFIGLSVPITFDSIIYFAFLGIIVYIIYYVVSGGYKIIRIILAPFRILKGKPKEKVVKKVIVKEKSKPEKKKKQKKKEREYFGEEGEEE